VELAADVLVKEDILGIRVKLIVIGLRRSSQILRAYRTLQLPLQSENHPMVRMYMKKAYRTGHEGTTLLHRSQRETWIIEGRQQAKIIH
jgi:hypothetical protein